MTAGVAYTIAMEIALPLLIWDRRWRWALICAGVLLHVMIGLSMGLVVFSLMMMVMVLSFFPPEVIDRLVNRITGTVGRLVRNRSEPSRSSKGELVLSR